jgi:anti-sigma regulatory factor (Ser/Thr protein kinase)
MQGGAVSGSSLTSGSGKPRDIGPDVILAEFALPSEPGNERLAMERVSAVVQDLGLPPARLERLKTAVAEATMNAMEHGNQYRPELPVVVRVLTATGKLIVLIGDQGSGDGSPADAETPDLEAKLEGRQTPRGWGLFLIQHMVDAMHVTTEGDRHTVELVMRLHGDDDDGGTA